MAEHPTTIRSSFSAVALTTPEEQTVPGIDRFAVQPSVVYPKMLEYLGKLASGVERMPTYTSEAGLQQPLLATELALYTQAGADGVAAASQGLTDRLSDSVREKRAMALEAARATFTILLHVEQGQKPITVHILADPRYRL